MFVVYHDFALKHKISLLDFTKNRNELEGEIIVKLLEQLQICDYDLKQHVGVITPFVEQEEEIKSHVKKQFGSGMEEIVMTIDKSQGIEKETIVISFTECNRNSKLPKNLCSAFTRAKSKLILIGHLESLMSITELEEYITWIRKQNAWLS